MREATRRTSSCRRSTPEATADPDDRLRLGRVTEWRDESGIAARGVGQKVWLTASGASEQEWSLLDVRSLEVGT